MVVHRCSSGEGRAKERRHQKTDNITETEERTMSLHDQLVAYVHTITEEPETRSGVWVEHSYARPENAAARTGFRAGEAAGDVRELLAPRRPARDNEEWLDVESAPPPPPVLPACLNDAPALYAEGDDEPEEHWEEAAAALAPSATHARLLASALEALRALRLERLAGGWGASREAVRAAVLRLRRALAPLWAWTGPPPQRPAAWLHATLLASLPRPMRALYDETVSELRRTRPRLAERLTGRPAPPPPASSPPEESPPVAADAGGPWLLWMCSNSTEESREARWAHYLRSLLHTRVWRPPRTSGVRSAPDAYCASLVAAARKAFAEVHAEAKKCGVSTVVAGGAGAGAALAADAGAADASGLLLLAPPLLTAEGARDDETLRVPAMLVTGSAAAQCWRGAAQEMRCARLLLVHGADDALRLPRAARRRLRLPQRALDAAVADECARWCVELNTAPPASPTPDYAHLPVVDIMQMPIVFADDDLTVTSGDQQQQHTRVLLPKRGVLRRPLRLLARNKID